MSNDILDTASISIENSSYAEVHADAFKSFIAMPVTKLDADQYLVNDLDGVTDGLFGSGNMNFLMMQVGQTNESLRAANIFDSANETTWGEATSAGFMAGPYHIASSENDGGMGTARLTSPKMDETSQGSPVFTGNDAHFNAGNESGTTANVVPNPSSSTLNASINGGNGANGSSGFSTHGSNGVSGSSGIDGSHGTIGANGTDGSNGSGTTTNITVVEHHHVVTETVENITHTVTNVTNNTTELVTNVTNNVTDLVTNITNNTTDIITTIIDNVFDTINNGQPLGPIGIDLSLLLDNLTNIKLDIISGDNILNVLDGIVDLSPILTPLGDLLGDLSAGLDLSVILNPFQYDNSTDDYDLQLLTGLDALGLPILSELGNLHIPLDPIEGLLGDIDINLDLTGNLLTDLLGGNQGDTDLGLGLGSALGGAPLLNGTENILLNPVEDLLGDIDLDIAPNIDLFNTANIDNAAGDTDIVIPLDLALLDHTLLADTLQISLDPLEQITGDIDLDLTASLNVLGDIANGLLDTLPGGSDAPNALSDIGDVLSGIGHGLLPDLGGPALDLDLVQSIADSVTGDFDLMDPLCNVFEVTSDIGGISSNLVDSVLHGIDSTLNTAIDTLSSIPESCGDLGGGLLGGLADLGGSLWTESCLPDAGNILGHGLGMDITSILPDPIISSPVIPMTAPSVITDTLHGLGLGGGRHFGGLFG